MPALIRPKAEDGRLANEQTGLNVKARAGSHDDNEFRDISP